VKTAIPDTEDEEDEMDVDDNNSNNSEDDEDQDEDWAALPPVKKSKPRRTRGKPATKSKPKRKDENEDEVIQLDTSEASVAMLTEGNGSLGAKDNADTKRVNMAASTEGNALHEKDEDENGEEDSDEDIDWEDALPAAPIPPTPTVASQQPIRDLELTIEQNEHESVFKFVKPIILFIAFWIVLT
jgi:hypothetical protein